MIGKGKGPGGKSLSLMTVHNMYVTSPTTRAEATPTTAHPITSSYEIGISPELNVNVYISIVVYPETLYNIRLIDWLLIDAALNTLCHHDSARTCALSGNCHFIVLPRMLSHALCSHRTWHYLPPHFVDTARPMWTNALVTAIIYAMSCVWHGREINFLALYKRCEPFKYIAIMMAHNKKSGINNILLFESLVHILRNNKRPQTCLKLGW